MKKLLLLLAIIITSLTSSAQHIIASPTVQGYWNLNGNGVTAANWLGTNSLTPLVFKTNNTERFRIGSAGNFSFSTGSVNFGSGTLTIGVPTYTDVNIWSFYQGSSNSYYQSILQNSNAGNTASTDFVVSNNLGTKNTYYGNFGMNSSTFAGSGAFNQPNAVYLTSQNGDLSIGTLSNNAIHFAVNSSTTDAMTIDANKYVYARGANSGAENNAIGLNAMPTSTAIRNSAYGDYAANGLISGANNSIYGRAAAFSPTAMLQSSIFGASALFSATDATNCVVIGFQAAVNSTSLNQGVIIGAACAANVTGSVNTIIGYNSAGELTTGTANTLLGANITATAAMNNNIILADGAGNKVYRWDGTTNTFSSSVSTGSLIATGTESVTTAIYTPSLLAIGTNTFITITNRINQTGLVGCTYFGTNSGQNDNLGNNVNAAFGFEAMKLNTSGTGNIAFGYRALLTATATANSAVGYLALTSHTAGNQNSAFGYHALQNDLNSLNNNAFGARALESYTGAAGGNNVMGSLTGFDLISGGNNTFLGDNTGRGITTGSGNIILGSAVAGLAAGLANNVIIAPGSAGVIKLQYDGTNWISTGGHTVTGTSIGNAAILSTGQTQGIGYATGSGSTVTQATGRTTGVTCNSINGAITLVSAAGLATYQTFQVTNTTVAATDVIIVNQKSGTDLYIMSVTNVAAGSFKISFATTGGITTEQPVFNFAVIKAVTN